MHSKYSIRLARNEEAMERWLTRMTRAANMVDALRKQRKRLLKAASPAPKVAVTTDGLCHCAAEPIPHAAHRAQPRYAPAVKVQVPTDDLDIPAFLRRGQGAQAAVDQIIAEGKAKDEAVKAQIQAEREARAKLKKAGGDARRKAKTNGQMRRIPPTGKAALTKIAAAD